MLFLGPGKGYPVNTAVSHRSQLQGRSLGRRERGNHFATRAALSDEFQSSELLKIGVSQTVKITFLYP